MNYTAKPKFLIVFSLCLSALLVPLTASAKPPSSFDAVFDVYRKGKLALESKISFSTDGKTWTMSSHSQGTKGMARIIGVNEKSSSKGTWHKGNPRPGEFSSEVSATLVSKGWKGVYDWQNKVVKTEHEDGQSTLDLQRGVIDPSTVGLVLRLGLERGETEWQLKVVDEDTIDHEHYRAFPPEKINTPLGCIETIKVEKVRAPESTRYTYTYFAPQHDLVPVLLVHGKKDGEHFESRIRTVSINGTPVKKVPDC